MPTNKYTVQIELAGKLRSRLMSLKKEMEDLSGEKLTVTRLLTAIIEQSLDLYGVVEERKPLHFIRKGVSEEAALSDRRF